MVLTVSFALFPVIGLCCHRRQRDTSRSLDASVEASEPHDFAVRLAHRSSKARFASTASRPAFVTIAKRPSVGTGWVRSITASSNEESGLFLAKGLDSKFADLPGEQKWAVFLIPRRGGRLART
jgi:hypothetical protein